MQHKTLPKHLLDKQESERNKTILMIEKAIIELKSQGYDIKIKDIIEVTGLSRSLFAKPHVRKTLIEYGIIQISDELPNDIYVKAEANTKLKLAEKEGYIKRLQFENEQLKYEIEVLRGELHLMMHKENNANKIEF
ncbi:MAG: DUF6262 family protein [Eubacteriales bacterium]